MKLEIRQKEMDAYVRELKKLGANTEGLLKYASYDAAGYVCGEIDKAISAIPVRDQKAWGTPEKPLTGLTAEQIKGLHDGLGIAKYRNDDGYVNCQIGFEGYNSSYSKTAASKGWTTTKQANQLIARAIESGTSWLKKHPFISPTIRKTKGKAEEMMREALDGKMAEFNASFR